MKRDFWWQQLRVLCETQFSVHTNAVEHALDYDSDSVALDGANSITVQLIDDKTFSAPSNVLHGLRFQSMPKCAILRQDTF